MNFKVGDTVKIASGDGPVLTIEHILPGNVLYCRFWDEEKRDFGQVELEKTSVKAFTPQT